MRRWLRWLVRRYRARWSGRGIFSGKVCTFSHTESCSAYALRLLDEPRGDKTSTTFELLRLVGARLRRCRDASVMRDPDGSRGWGRAYDVEDARAFEARLVAARERSPSIAAMLRALADVARFRGEAALSRDALLRARELEACLRPCSLVVRDLQGALRRAEKRTCRAFVALALPPALVAALVVAGAPLPWIAAPLLLCAVLAARARALLRWSRRLDQQLAAFEMMDDAERRRA